MVQYSFLKLLIEVDNHFSPEKLRHQTPYLCMLYVLVVALLQLVSYAVVVKPIPILVRAMFCEFRLEGLVQRMFYAKRVFKLVPDLNFS